MPSGRTGVYPENAQIREAHGEVLTLCLRIASDFRSQSGIGTLTTVMQSGVSGSCRRVCRHRS